MNSVAMVSTALGVLFLTFLVMDVLLTVFPPLGHGGPVHRRQNQLAWKLFRLVGRRLDGSPRPKVLGLAGPVIAMMSVAVWGVWLVLGFALIYAPYSSTFSTTAVSGGWAETLYYSGYVATTLGLGDVVATTPGLRLLTVLEAMGGFALFAVATSYVFSITRELATAGTLALELASFRACGDGRTEGWTLAADGGDEAVARWTEAWARSLFRMAHAHGQYPLLQFFRAADADRALPVQLGRVLELVEAETDRSSGAGTGEPELPRPDSPAVSPLLRHALLRYLVEVNRACIPAGFDPLPAPPSELPAERLHARLLRYTCHDPRAAG
ncbi:MAG: two pore domain potassium channel family protein [Gemmatimonadetes bacterium]|nr:two pore domain potassium channel family protein [Gemmatimonadota bacterium]